MADAWHVCGAIHADMAIWKGVNLQVREGSTFQRQIWVPSAFGKDGEPLQGVHGRRDV